MDSLIPTIAKLPIFLLALVLVVIGVRLEISRGRLSPAALTRTMLAILITGALFILMAALETGSGNLSPGLRSSVFIPARAYVELGRNAAPRLIDFLAGQLTWILAAALAVTVAALARFRNRAQPFIVVVILIVLALAAGSFLAEGRTGWMTWLIAGSALYAAFLGRISPLPRHPRRQPVRLITLLLLVLTIVLAMQLRFDRLAAVPMRFDNTEAEAGLRALGIVEGRHPTTTWETIRWRGFAQTRISAPYLYISSFFFRIFGPGTASFRLISVLAGTVSVLLVFLIFRTLFSDTVGLITAFMFAVSPMNINYSRMNLLPAVTIAVGLLIIHLVLRAGSGKHPGAYFFLGLTVSFAGYFYAPIKFLILICGVLLAGYTIFSRKNYFKRLLGVILLALGILTIIRFLNLPVLELISPGVVSYESVWHRTADHVYTPEPDYQRAIPLIRENIEVMVHTFFHPNFNYDPWPGRFFFFNPVFTILLVAGLFYLLFNLRAESARVTLFFFFPLLLPLLLSRPPMVARRLLFFLPFGYCLAAIPLALLIRESGRLFPRWGRIAGGGLVGIFLFLAGSGHADLYFNNRQPAGFWERERYFAEKVKSLSEDYFLYVVPFRSYSRPLINFISYTGETPRSYRYVNPDQIERLISGREEIKLPAALTFPRRGAPAGLARRIKEAYPEAELLEYRDSFGQQALQAYLIPRPEDNRAETP